MKMKFNFFSCSRLQLSYNRYNLFCSFLSMIILSSSVISCANTKSCTNNPIDPWLAPDSTICNKLTEKGLIETLFMPNDVKCYILIHKDSIPEDELSLVKGYARDSLMAEFGIRETTVLQYILLSNPFSYSTDSLKIEAPYLPTLEFVFSRKDSLSASVVISTSNQSWTIFYNGEKQFNYNYADRRIVERFCKYYINEYFKPQE